MCGSNSGSVGGGFHHIAVKVFDFEKTIKFYTEGLGFKIYLSWGQGDERGAMIDTGNANYLEVFAGGSQDIKPEGSYIHLAFRSENVDLAIERARSMGAEVTMEPNDIEIKSNPVLKARIAFCKGPEGEVIEFFQEL